MFRTVPVKLRICPTGCTQRRTLDNRLTQKKTFDGRKCKNCGYEIKIGHLKPNFRKFSKDFTKFQ